MKTLLAVFGIVWLVGIIWMYYIIKNAPLGYEKDDKFYYGDETNK